MAHKAQLTGEELDILQKAADIYKRVTRHEATNESPGSLPEFNTFIPAEPFDPLSVAYDIHETQLEPKLPENGQLPQLPHIDQSNISPGRSTQHLAVPITETQFENSPRPWSPVPESTRVAIPTPDSPANLEGDLSSTWLTTTMKYSDMSLPGQEHDSQQNFQALNPRLGAPSVEKITTPSSMAYPQSTFLSPQPWDADSRFDQNQDALNRFAESTQTMRHLPYDSAGFTPMEYFSTLVQPTIQGYLEPSAASAEPGRDSSRGFPLLSEPRVTTIEKPQPYLDSFDSPFEHLVNPDAHQLPAEMAQPSQRGPNPAERDHLHPEPVRNQNKLARRQPYSLVKRLATAHTRRLGMCIRCRMNRDRCDLDPENPAGPCLTCQNRTFNIFGLPCLRYKISDSVLFRTFSNSEHENAFPLIGPRHGRFNIKKTWVSTETKFIELTQDRVTKLKLHVQQFQAPDQDPKDTKGIGGKGRRLFAIPWALKDPKTSLKTIQEFIDQSIEHYINAILDPSDFCRSIFQTSESLMSDPKYNPLIFDCLRLWTTCRFIEGGWRCCGEEKLGAERLGNSLRPSWWISPPPYIDYEFTSLVIHQVLGPLRKKVLKTLQEMMYRKNPQDWLCIFLSTFILLHNYELLMDHEVKFSTKRRYPNRYVDMNLVRGIHSGSKTLIAHFHHVCKGNVPFRNDFDWTLPTNQRMAKLSNDQMAFIDRLIHRLQIEAPRLTPVSLTDRYEDKYWFTSQLFTDGWEPRETCEHSPPASLDP